MLDAIERAMNGLSDTDWGWYPFLHLRPAQSESMTTTHVACMAVRFGPLVGAVAAAAAMIRKGGTEHALDTFGGSVFAATLFFFVVYRPTFAVAWNRRASRLRGS